MIRGTKEWAVAEINCSVGCPHDCKYCYGRIAALKKGLIASAAEWPHTRISEEAVSATWPLYSGQVMFPAAHDIVAENLQASLQVISGLLKAGNRVLVVSKPAVSCVRKICTEFYQQREQLLFRFTITARDSKILSFWEPGAPAYAERLDSLQLAFASGFETSVSIEPILDLGDIEPLIAEIEPYVTHSIWLGKMNRIEERVGIDSRAMEMEVERIRSEQSDGRIDTLYRRLKDNPLLRWKESIKQVVGLPLAAESGLDI